MKKLVRTIHPEIRVLDEAKGIVEYVASDETLDHYREIISAKGWKFSFFSKNAPFVDSHNYDSIGQLLGNVVDFRVEKNQLIETVQWAIEAGDASQLIQFGWKMTKAGFLKAVSVGFFPVRSVSKYDNNGGDLARAATELGLDTETAAKVSTIYLEQEQIELSACVIGANPTALARAYRNGVCDDSDLTMLEAKISETQPEAKHARAAEDSAAAARATTQRNAEDWLRKVETQIKSI